MNETQLPLIFLIVEEAPFGQQLVEALRERYGNQYEYVITTDDAEALELIVQWSKQQRQLVLTVAEAFLINVPTDGLLAQVNERFMATYLVYLAETTTIEVTRLSTMPATRIIPKAAPLEELIEIFAFGIRDYEYRMKRRADFRLVRTLNRHFQDLAALEEPKAMYQRLMKFVIDNAPVERGYYLSSDKGQVQIEAVAARSPIEDGTLRIRLSKEPALLNAEVVRALTQALQDTEENPRLTVIPVRRQGRIVAYLYLEHASEENAFGQAHRELLNLAVDHLALLLATVEPTASPTSRPLPPPARISNDHLAFSQSVQQSYLRPASQLREHFPQAFIFWEPRQQVSASFYWFAERYHRFLIAAAECNEDGVAAAITGLISTNLLSEVAAEQALPQAEELLSAFNERFRRVFRYDPLKMRTHLYINMSLCAIDVANAELHFAGAHRPVILFHGGQLLEIKGDNMPVGLQTGDNASLSFRRQTLPLATGDMLYLFNDGMVRQIQKNPMNLRSTRSLAEALTEVVELPAEEQLRVFQRLAAQSKQQEALEHDLLLIGIRFSDI